MGTIAITCRTQGLYECGQLLPVFFCKKGEEEMLGHVATEMSHSSPEPPNAWHFQPRVKSWQLHPWVTGGSCLPSVQGVKHLQGLRFSCLPLEDGVTSLARCSWAEKAVQALPLAQLCMCQGPARPPACPQGPKRPLVLAAHSPSARQQHTVPPPPL